MKIYHLIYMLILNSALAAADDAIRVEDAIAINTAKLAFAAKLEAAREKDEDAMTYFEGRIRAFDWTTRLNWEESIERSREVGAMLDALVDAESEIISEFRNYMECLPDVPWSENTPFCYKIVFGYHEHRYGSLQGYLLSSMAKHDPKSFEIYVRDSLANDQTSDNRKRTIAIALGVGDDFFFCEELLLQMDAAKNGQVRYSLKKLRFDQMIKWDTDKDLILTLEEFSEAVSAKPDLLSKFKGYDLNGDGEVTDAEFRNVDQLLGLQ